MGELVKLTVTHGGFEPGSTILPGISEGWPTILASLKTLLETGAPLDVRMTQCYDVTSLPRR